MGVHEMNDGGQENQLDYRSLRLLDEISKGEPLSQRDMSRKLNIALGLVNTYLKNLVTRGYVKMRAIPPRRYAYYLTPKGFHEKTRLTYDLLRQYTSLYREARKDFKRLFAELRRQGMKSVHFAGLEEISEIAYLSLKEAGIELTGVVDDDSEARSFFDRPVIPLGSLERPGESVFVVTSIGRREELVALLVAKGVRRENIHVIG